MDSLYLDVDIYKTQVFLYANEALKEQKNVSLTAYKL